MICDKLLVCCAKLCYVLRAFREPCMLGPLAGVNSTSFAGPRGSFAAGCAHPSPMKTSSDIFLTHEGRSQYRGRRQLTHRSAAEEAAVSATMFLHEPVRCTRAPRIAIAWTHKYMNMTMNIIESV